MFVCSAFVELLQRFPTWSALRTFLESNEGGRLRIIEQAESPLVLIRYTKGVSLICDHPWVPWFRSVVWNTMTNLPVCLGPRKSLEATEEPAFPVRPSSLRVEEFVEGTTINCFLDERGKLTWTTRSSLGATHGFYSNTTFGEMADDALDMMGMSRKELRYHLVKNGYSCASFVLQHPAHARIQSVARPSLTLIHFAIVHLNGSFTILDTPISWPAAFERWGPMVYDPLENDETMRWRMERMIKRRPYDWQGLVFREGEHRWRIRTPAFQHLMELRGNEAHSEERYLRLRAQDASDDYLHYWPEDRIVFERYDSLLIQIESDLYYSYCAVFKQRTQPLSVVPPPLRRTLIELNNLYHTSLRRDGLSVTEEIVNIFVWKNYRMIAEILRGLNRSYLSHLENADRCA